MAKRRPNLKERAGRDLEQLVAALEGGFRPPGTVIRSPDWLPDRDTGAAREVDVSVRFAGPRGEALVVLECRDRRASQDVRWFEELASKRESIGADEMIAVSSSGFTAGALKKAARYGIQARHLRNISLQSIASWLWLDGGLLRHESRVLSASVTFDRAKIEPSRSQVVQEELRSLPKVDLDVPNLILSQTGEWLSIEKFWYRLLALDREQSIFALAPEDGTRKCFNIAVDLSHPTLQLALPLPSGEILLQRVTITVELWKNAQRPRLVRAREYGSPEGDIARIAEYAVGEVELAVRKDTLSGLYSIAVSGAPTAQYSGTLAIWNPGPEMKGQALRSIAPDAASPPEEGT